MADDSGEYSTRELEFLITIARELPVAIWAAAGPDHNYSIELWSPGAEEMYGIPRSEALGKNYLDLFVNPYERQQAIRDHDKVRRTAGRYRNLARDRIARGEAVVLTEGFGLWHPEYEEYIQAEIAIDVTDVPGQQAEWLNVVRDTTLARREAEAGIRLMEEVLAALRVITAQADEQGLVERITAGVVAGANATAEGAMCRVWYVGDKGRLVLVTSAGDASGVKPSYDEPELAGWIRQTRRLVFADYLSGSYRRPHSRVANDLTATPEPIPAGRTRRGPPFPGPIAVRDGNPTPFIAAPIILSDNQVGGVLLLYLPEGFNLTQNSQALTSVAFATRRAVLAIEIARGIRTNRTQQKVIAEMQERTTRARIASDYAHTIRKRCTMLQLLCELLRDTASHHTDERTSTAIELIETQIAEIQTRGEDLKAVLDPEPVDLFDVLEGLANRYCFLYPGLNLNRDVKPGLTVFGIRPLLEFAIDDLLTNALEATDMHGPIDLRSRVTPRRRGEDPRVIVELRDWGRGIPDTLSETFWEFGVSTKGSLGYGVGRAREIIQQAGGTITRVESQSFEGSGELFRLSFPKYSSSSI